MRGRDTRGEMAGDFDPLKWGGDYTESSAWQATFAVPHDLEGLASLFCRGEGSGGGGGDESAMLKKLDALFAAEPDYRCNGYGGEIHEMTELAAIDFGQCAISNQPSFHIPFIYAALGQPDRSTSWVHRLAKETFSFADDGFPGDEDNGTMAAWYIFACLDMYPVNPASREMVKITPIVSSFKFNVAQSSNSGDDAPNVGDNDTNEKRSIMRGQLSYLF